MQKGKPMKNNITAKDITKLSAGFPTQTIDINGERVCLGDKVVNNYKGESNKFFIVVFEDNAFRKKYEGWDETLTKPMLEIGKMAETMRLMVVKSACPITDDKTNDKTRRP